MADHMVLLGVPQFCTFIAELDDKQKKISYDSITGGLQGQSLAVQVSGGAPARTSSVTPPIKDNIQKFGEIGSIRFPSRALALLFFFILF
jgi:hypothetical protein